MKFGYLVFTMLLTLSAHAEGPCNIRPGTSLGIKVVEFVTNNTIHSKMPFSETTPSSLLEEMMSLQDMGICQEKIQAEKCVLKFEKLASNNYITLYRGKARWSSWTVKSKSMAQDFVKHMRRVGFCN